MSSREELERERQAELDRLKQERWGKSEDLEKERGDEK